MSSPSGDWFGLCVWVTVRHLKADMDRSKLVGADKHYHRVFLEFRKEFDKNKPVKGIIGPALPPDDRKALIDRAEALSVAAEYYGRRISVRRAAEVTLHQGALTPGRSFAFELVLPYDAPFSFAGHAHDAQWRVRASAKVPLASPSRQWSTRPAVARIASPYVLRTPLLLTFTVIVCDGASLPKASTATMR